MKKCSWFYNGLPVEYQPLIFPDYNVLNRKYKDLYCLISDVIKPSFNLNFNFSISQRDSNFNPLSNMFETNIRTTSTVFAWSAVYAYIMFSPHSEKALQCTTACWNSTSESQVKFVVFFFLSYLGMFLSFLRKIPGFHN